MLKGLLKPLCRSIVVEMGYLKTSEQDEPPVGYFHRGTNTPSGVSYGVTRGIFSRNYSITKGEI